MSCIQWMNKGEHFVLTQDVSCCKISAFLVIKQKPGKQQQIRKTHGKVFFSIEEQIPLNIRVRMRPRAMGDKRFGDFAGLI